MLKLFILSTMFIFSAFSQEKVSNFTTQIASYKVDIIELEEVKVIKEHIDKKDFFNSYLVLEVSGIYESNGEEETIGVQLDRTDDGTPSFGYQVYEGKLFSLKTSKDPIAVGGGFTNSLSIRKKFKTQFKVTINGWDGDQDKAEWTILFKYKKWQPIFHTETRGVTVLFFHDKEGTEWSFRDIGFDSLP